MAVTHETVLLVYAVATVVAVGLGGAVWRHREKTGAVALTVAVVGAALWAGSLFVATAVDSYAVSVFLKRFLYVGVVISVAGTFLFVLEYTGREHLVTRRTVALLSIEPILVVLLVFTNPGNLFFEAVSPDPSLAVGVEIAGGPAFAAHLLYSYLLSVAGTVMILEFLYNSRSLYRGQAAALLGATTVPLVTNLLYISGLFESFGADTTPIGFIVAAALYAVAILRYRLIDIVPIARDRVLNTVSEGVFVVDRNDRLIDVNPTGRRFISVDDESALIGRTVDELFTDTPSVRERYHELTAEPTESTVELAYAGSYYEIRATPITDDRDRHVGWLILASDITERKHREQELERQNERLDQFASLVSHDLRNPLNVADGYVDIARETGDTSYLDEVERSHERMETIIADVLALTRSGNAVTDPEPVSIATLAERAWAGVETSAATVAIDGDARLVADEDRTLRLLENLFRNALEHGVPAAGSRSTVGDTGSVDGSTALEVTVGTVDDGGSIEGFYVEDDGVGIPSEYRDRVLEDGYTTDDEGTGLGLSIVEQIAEAHGWSVSVTGSESGGARFEFTGVDPAPETLSARTSD